MNKTAQLYRAVAAGVIAFFVAYTVPLYVKLPALWYLPLARSWELAVKPSTLAMDWYGRTLSSSLIGLAVAFVVRALTKNDRPYAAGRWTLALVLAVALGAAAYAEYLIGRIPTPLPAELRPRQPPDM